MVGAKFKSVHYDIVADIWNFVDAKWRKSRWLLAVPLEEPLGNHKFLHLVRAFADDH